MDGGLVAVVIASVTMLYTRRRQGTRRYWVHSILKKRQQRGEYYGLVRGAVSGWSTV